MFNIFEWLKKGQYFWSIKIIDTQISVSTSEVLIGMQPLSAHSHLVCGGFQAAVAELSGHDREYVLHKTKTIYCLAPYIKSLLTAAATAKSLQLCLTLCNTTDSSPPGSSVPGILQARTLEWVAISFSNAWKWKVEVKSLSCVRLLVTPWTAAYQTPPSMGLSRQVYWSGVPLLECWVTSKARESGLGIREE